ncbi:rhomboid family intramembrane serine protease [Methanosalsum zhilinae]|uniref:rhomboid family intramembrane serine protease n=1 Tax=Methanosalsum zhilinae TaxID=39669 RepID=UPI00155AB969|nr:rhomboid family intramembrane serine protease [Methanosalsum zhilinae]
MNLEIVGKQIKYESLLIDIFIFLVFIPAFLSIVFYSHLNERFVLYLADPTLFTLYFSNFAHSGFLHFFDNILAYVVIIPIIFLLRTNRKRFYVDMVLIFSLTPFMVSFFTVMFVPARTSLGFSGIVAALIAYYLFSVYEFTQKQLRVCLNYSVLILIFGFSFLFVLIQYALAGYAVIDYIILLSFLLLLLLPDSLKEMARAYRSMKKMSHQKKGKITVIMISVFMFVSYSLAIILFLILFPLELATPTGQTNILGHLIGYCAGLILPILYRRTTACEYQNY